MANVAEKTYSGINVTEWAREILREEGHSVQIAAVGWDVTIRGKCPRGVVLVETVDVENKPTPPRREIAPRRLAMRVSEEMPLVGEVVS